MKRRTFLQGTVAASAAGMAASAGLLTPTTVIADDHPNLFGAESLDAVMAGLGATPEESKDITLKAPEIAENGAVVPITISTTIEGATEIVLLVANNPTPLAAIFKLGELALPTVATRVKMGKTSEVIALVKAGDKTYSTKQEVKVTIGGCGG